MGLFMGFSFLSIVEFIYYAILRPYRTFKQSQYVKRRTSTNIRKRPSLKIANQQRPMAKQYFQKRYTTNQFIPYKDIQYPKFVARASTTGNGSNFYETINHDVIKTISKSMGVQQQNSIIFKN